MAMSKMKNSGKTLVEQDAAVKSICDRMEADLSKSSSGFLVGDHYTLADVIGTALCARVHVIKGMTFFGPNTVKFFEMVKKRPTYKEANIIDNIHKADMGAQAIRFFTVLGATLAAGMASGVWYFMHQ